jgi:hypothetical protein
MASEIRINPPGAFSRELTVFLLGKALRVLNIYSWEEKVASFVSNERSSSIVRGLFSNLTPKVSSNPYVKEALTA